ncbi:MAG TPA: hypothetical protein VLK22_04200 [Candidatus Udaeobacter sp.]|nr:hypothetical protein [Candidatus Udaeobacter sp.]
MKNFKLTLIILGILVISLGSASLVFYKRAKDLASDPQKVSQEQNKKTIAAVGKLVILPEGELPIIATVTDPDKVKTQQAFFAKASQGDKILIYTQARKAIMYRPSENKIVEIAPLVIGSPNTAAN